MTSILSRTLGALLMTLGINTAVQAEVTQGDAAPNFRLQDQHGQWHSLEQYQGHWLVLYFYPKDDTPGCTKEACAFRDNFFAFEELGATVLGVSLDDVDSHAEFAEKYSLPFSLLADIGGETAKRYGILRNFAGLRMAKRQSYLISPDGEIAKHYAKVRPANHTDEVLADLRMLINSADTRTNQ